MKGLDVPMVVVVIVLAIAVLMIFIWWATQGKGTVDIVLVENMLRQCCSDRAIWDCHTDSGTLNSINCKVPWDPGQESLEDLKTRVGLTNTQLCDFCNCDCCNC